MMHMVDTHVWRQHVWRNRLQSWLLLAIMEGFLAILGWMIWGPAGIVMLIIVGLIGGVLTPSMSPWMLARMYQASPIELYRAPVLYELLVQLCQQAELRHLPSLYYVPSRMLNAFAIGSPMQSSIFITDGLIRQMSQRELTGVLAHEISHIRNNDLRVMGLADLFSRTTNLLSLTGQLLLLFNLPLIMFSEYTISWWLIAVLIAAPLISVLAQLALSRTREFDADLNAVALTGDPDGLASALAKIEHVQGGWMERLFIPSGRVLAPSLLRTHPESEERIRRLLTLKPRYFSRAEDGVLDGDLKTYADVERHTVPQHPRWHITGLWH